MENSDEALRAHIVDCCETNWKKMAMILTRVQNKSGGSFDIQEIAVTISKMVELGELDAQGNLERWRNSEVRLPTKNHTK